MTKSTANCAHDKSHSFEEPDEVKVSGCPWARFGTGGGRGDFPPNPDSGQAPSDRLCKPLFRHQTTVAMGYTLLWKHTAF